MSQSNSFYGSSEGVEKQPSGIFGQLPTQLSRRYQSVLDRSTPYYITRWIVLAVLFVFYGIRVYLLQGWYIITYALGIYLLNLFIAFLTPKIDPATHEPEEEDSGGLPMKANEEYKPFMRRLPEFKFWHSSLRAVTIAMFCTCFDALNIPVFWPILVLYFFVLFSITMKRQIKHMIKYRYLPFSHGKATYKGRPEGGKSSSK